MAQYLLMLYQEPGWTDKLSPEEMQKALEKYLAWSKKPFNLDGKRLAHGPGRVVRMEGGQLRATDGPYAEAKEVMGGFYLIEAANYQEAVQRTHDHPHLEYGGKIEIRQIHASEG
jgi:hypothetical protein